MPPKTKGLIKPSLRLGMSDLNGQNFDSKYNPAKHPRRSIRLKGYDYSQKGAYFVTICIKEGKCFLGGIKNTKSYYHRLERLPIGVGKKFHSISIL